MKKTVIFTIILIVFGVLISIWVIFEIKKNFVFFNLDMLDQKDAKLGKLSKMYLMSFLNKAKKKKGKTKAKKYIQTTQSLLRELKNEIAPKISNIEDFGDKTK